MAGVDGTALITVTRHIEPAAARSGSDRDLVVVAVAGEVDLETVTLLRTALLDATERRPHVCCDLSQVTFFGAAGVNALVAANHRATAHGSEFFVRGVQGIVRRVLEITRLDQTLRMEPAPSQGG
ncbi:MAG TPA: STAS domain-containing protein [Micromonosporaceae bacterium]|nr:STAS domain-containing protein [Micromonosporaceae bacterium]